MMTEGHPGAYVQQGSISVRTHRARRSAYVIDKADMHMVREPVPVNVVHGGAEAVCARARSSTPPATDAVLYEEGALGVECGWRFQWRRQRPSMKL